MQLQRESGHSKHTTFHSSSEGEEKGQQRSLYQERGGWRVIKEKEQKGVDTAVCIIMIGHWPFFVQSIDMAIQRSFCADIIANQL